MYRLSSFKQHSVYSWSLSMSEHSFSALYASLSRQEKPLVRVKVAQLGTSIHSVDSTLILNIQTEEIVRNMDI